MKILILGSNGQLGRELQRAAWPQPAVLLPYDLDRVDIAVPGAAAALIDEHRPDLAVNAAAYTAVDKAESEPDAAFAANARAPGYLAQACAPRAIPLVHISTDYVFDGTKEAPYVESDSTGPLSVYGRSKRDGEAAVRDSLPRHLILRTSWVYSVFGGNFVKTMLRLGAERSQLRVVADQTGAPTAACDLAGWIAQMAPAAVSGRAPYGTYHACNGGETSWCGFAEAIFADVKQRTGRSVAVTPIATAEYPTPARRPINSRLDCSLLQQEFGIVPRPWQEALQDVLDELAGQAG
jgi:dTDP-4-dehydrorhamnose reductase